MLRSHRILAPSATGLVFLALAGTAHADAFQAGSSFKPSALTMKTATVSTKKVTAPKNVTSLSIVARGTACSDVVPSLGVQIDGKTVGTIAVKYRTASKYKLSKAVAAGSRKITLVLRNPSKGSCVRTVRVDSVTLVTSTATTTPSTPSTPSTPVKPAPTPTPTPAPTPDVDEPEVSVPEDEVEEPAAVKPTTPAPTTPASPVVPQQPALAISKVEAETLALVPTSAGRVLEDSAASGGKAWRLFAGGALSAEVNGSIASVSIRALAELCQGAPKVELSVDGTVVKTIEIPTTSWATSTVMLAKPLSAGKHTVKAFFTNNGGLPSTATCDRNLHIDWLGTSAPATPTPLPAEPTPTTPAPTTPAPTTPAPTTPAPTTPAPTTPAPTTPAPTTPAPTTPTPTTPVPTTPLPTTPVPTTPVPTTPVPTTPTEPSTGRAKLRWAPPKLENPTTIYPNTVNQTITMDTTKDYIIKLPSTPKGGMWLKGGRNIQVIGGELRITNGTAFYITGATGTVHVEGLLIDNTGRPEGDAISVDAPKASLQVQNVRVLGVTGSQNGEHGDILQPWGGLQKLRVDRLSGYTGYQGLFLRPSPIVIGQMDLSNIDLNYVNNATNNGGDLIWFTTDCVTAPANLSEVYVGQAMKGYTSSHTVWPKLTDKSCPAKAAGNAISWPSLPIKGSVTTGTPKDGNFVKAGTVGLGYTTPGYL